MPYEQVIDLIVNKGITVVLLGIFIYVLFQLVQKLPDLIESFKKIGDAMQMQGESNEKLSEVLNATTKKHEVMEESLNDIRTEVTLLNQKYYINESDVRSILNSLKSLEEKYK